ncbi:PfkB family carbohydrate kinase [Natronincola ferrireducens]|uniref:Sugar or nucleoside kinase, ribokinase family n=1 Tax=Natronincola ferrireducens TaxID=393762 RepID=A0A1G9EYV6_9FIRM|nr:PfkB family carbohydrate kinase [Natronincola ferrireducens]SDK81367.1 Sugar or nucleoside kinase, ribokinase family [Natronincola ferrireducens]
MIKKNLIIGATILDIIMEIPRLPKSGEDVYAKNQIMSIGGCAYNVANIHKNFNAPYTLFAPIGRGIYGSFIESKLIEMGHEILIKSNKKDNGYCLSFVEDNGERTFLTYPGIECEYSSEWFDQINPLDYKGVYISGYEIEGEGGQAIIDFLERNTHLSIYFGPGPRITYIEDWKLEKIFSLNPIIHLNEAEIKEYKKEPSIEQAIVRIEEKTKSPVVVTLGGAGACLYENKRFITIPAISTKVVDTIGAGDSHIATIMAMQTFGMSLQKSCALANQIAAKVVSTKGPTLNKNLFREGEFIYDNCNEN